MRQKNLVLVYGQQALVGLKGSLNISLHIAKKWPFTEWSTVSNADVYFFVGGSYRGQSIEAN